MDHRICENCQYWAKIDQSDEVEGEPAERVFFDAEGERIEDAGRCLVQYRPQVVGIRAVKNLGPVVLASHTCKDWTLKRTTD